jgi:hypothetical protein
VGPRAGLNAVMKRKIPTPYQNSNPPIIQPVAQRYTTDLSRLPDSKVCPVILHWVTQQQFGAISTPVRLEFIRF